VFQKDLLSNKLIVTHLDKLGKSRFIVGDVNWIRKKEIETIFCGVKIRYKSKIIKCEVVKKNKNEYCVTLSQKIKDITPGQFAVFYEGEEVLGGGVIREIK